MTNRPVFLLLIGLLTWNLAMNRASSAEKQASKAEQGTLITLTVDFGDGFEKRFTRIEWRDGITVLDAMKLAGKHPRGALAIALRGRGATTLLTEIDGLKSEGGKGRNWIFRVNGKLGERSIGVQNLRAGDTVLWRFERYR